GLYGVTAHNVGRRTGEIGVRIALGASRGQVVRFVLRGAFLLIAFGLILGIPLSLATSRVLSSQLYGLNPLDPVPIVLAVAVLGLFGLIATLVPARRATRVDPMAALRYERSEERRVGKEGRSRWLEKALKKKNSNLSGKLMHSKIDRM